MKKKWIIIGSLAVLFAFIIGIIVGMLREDDGANDLEHLGEYESGIEVSVESIMPTEDSSVAEEESKSNYEKIMEHMGNEVNLDNIKLPEEKVVDDLREYTVLRGIDDEDYLESIGDIPEGLQELSPGDYDTVYIINVLYSICEGNELNFYDIGYDGNISFTEDDKSCYLFTCGDTSIELLIEGSLEVSYYKVY